MLSEFAREGLLLAAASGCSERANSVASASERSRIAFCLRTPQKFFKEKNGKKKKSTSASSIRISEAVKGSWNKCGQEYVLAFMPRKPLTAERAYYLGCAF